MLRLAAIMLVLAAASAHAQEPSVEVSAGGGVSAFSDAVARQTTELGGAWDLRLTARPRRFLAGEIAYVGTANAVSTRMTEFTPNGVIVGGGIESDLRLQLPWVVEPYVFGGVGWDHFALVYSGLRSSTSLHGGENVAVFPVGGGVQAFLSRRVAVDARFAYRVTSGDRIEVENNGAATVVAQGLDHWTLAARFGFLF
jgi:hypothetical protein